MSRSMEAFDVEDVLVEEEQDTPVIAYALEGDIITLEDLDEDSGDEDEDVTDLVNQSAQYTRRGQVLGSTLSNFRIQTRSIRNAQLFTGRSKFSDSFDSVATNDHFWNGPKYPIAFKSLYNQLLERYQKEETPNCNIFEAHMPGRADNTKQQYASVYKQWKIFCDELFDGNYFVSKASLELFFICWLNRWLTLNMLPSVSSFDHRTGALRRLAQVQHEQENLPNHVLENNTARNSTLVKDLFLVVRHESNNIKRNLAQRTIDGHSIDPQLLTEDSFEVSDLEVISQKFLGKPDGVKHRAFFLFGAFSGTRYQVVADARWSLLRINILPNIGPSQCILIEQLVPNDKLLSRGGKPGKCGFVLSKYPSSCATSALAEYFVDCFVRKNQPLPKFEDLIDNDGKITESAEKFWEHKFGIYVRPWSVTPFVMCKMSAVCKQLMDSMHGNGKHALDQL